MNTVRGRTLLRALGVLAVAASWIPPGAVSSQDAVQGVIQGRIRDEAGAPLSGVLLRVFSAQGEEPSLGRLSNAAGFFQLKPLMPGGYRLQVECLGFRTEHVLVELSQGERRVVDLALATQAVVLEGISVEAERSRDRMRFEEEAGITVREMRVEQIKALPGLVEADPMRAVEVLPGVVTVSDFSSAFNVRGGSSDQNLVLLDGLPIFNPAHLGGFFSVFNGDMVKRAELQSGGFPSRFGGRVSSVLDVQSDAGDGSFRGDAGVSLLATRLALGGELPSAMRKAAGLEHSNWRVSGRRSYVDQLLKGSEGFPYHLEDLQGVLENWTKGGDRISLTGYRGRDVLSLSNLDPEDFPLRMDWAWGNDVFGGRWTHLREDGGSLEVKGGYSRYTSGMAFPDFEDMEVRSLVSQMTIEADLEANPSSGLTVATGGGLAGLSYENITSTGTAGSDAGEGKGKNLFAYVQADWHPGTAWIVELGARGDGWLPASGSSRFVASPRFSAKRFLGGGQWAAKVSGGRYTQFIHSIRNEEIPLGNDVWVLAREEVPHVVSDQVQAGVEGYPGEGWFVSLEGYLRDFDGVLTTNVADDPNDHLDDFLSGKGRAYGADLFVRKDRGATTGWLALSWLRATRTYPDVGSGLDPAPEVTYPPVFDRRLDVDLVLQRDVRENLQIGLRWNLGTGLPYTRPVGSYAYLDPRVGPGGGSAGRQEEDPDTTEKEGIYGVVLGARNSARYPARHRLDLSVRWTVQRSWGHMVPYLNLLNVYNRKNTLFYFFQFEQSPPVRSGISMFPFLPTVGVEVTFR